MAGRKRTCCEFCEDSWTSEYIEHRNGYCLWAEYYPYNFQISVIAQGNDENGDMQEDAITIPMYYCPNCGRKLTEI